MKTFTLELNFSVSEITAGEICKLCNTLGIVSIGTYAEPDSRYGKGARVIGRDLLKMGESYFEIAEVGDKWVLNAVKMKDTYVSAKTMPVEIKGLSSGDTVLFLNEEDAIQWLTNLSDRELKELYVNDSQIKYSGCAVGYKMKVIAEKKAQAAEQNSEK